MDRLVATFGTTGFANGLGLSLRPIPLRRAGGDIFGTVKSVCEVIDKQFNRLLPSVASQEDAINSNNIQRESRLY